MNRTQSTRQRKVRAKYLTYRIDEIPSKYSTKDQLKQCFHSDDKGYVHVNSFVPSISDFEGREHTATVQYLADGEPRLDADVENIELDKDFRGFTPLNAPSENVAADVIAVTGLGGHAFGSWVNSKGDMWLRDYLPKDLQGRARILIYGYPSALQDGNNQSSLSDYSACFMQDLMGIRSQHGIQDRPLVLIGHSLGGLIVKKALSDLKPGVLSRLPVRAILFFGTPHRGLNIKALETMVQGQENAKLIKDLEGESAALENLREGFKRIANTFKIYSFVETRTTPMVTEIDGVWQRGAHREMMVSRNSAMLDCDTETIRMVTADHSEMVKLRKGQEGPYRYIVSIIKEALQSAPEKWEDFKQGKDGEPDLPSDPSRDDRQPEHVWKRSFNKEATPDVLREDSLEPDQSNISEVQYQDEDTLPSQPPTRA
ncbi:hypothetical protein FSARC_11830 [Fusarium sarcochroum]|uniref:DUF676 domain-containing protein n=1 Tax=Fusarium sarcochroum TaxID=1208366 RepID=A0A8H4TCN3_9HYPO|nr:hypothetical protein FSARC_11830 [Fusarium sarcochroum]